MNATSEALLRERARALARPVQTAQADAALIELVEFALADERYAVPSSALLEVQGLRELCELPGLPPFWRGLTCLRGRLLPVLDLRVLFDLPAAGLGEAARLLLLRGAGLEVGLLADRLVDAYALASFALQRGLPSLAGIRADYLLGVSGDGLAVLDVERLLADPRLRIDDEVTT